jgi:nickel/cobalt transporter (NicO) family protein
MSDRDRSGGLVRRVVFCLALGVGMFCSFGLLSAPAASAHPLGNFTINRFSGLEVSPGRITVTYVVDMAEIPTAQEMPNIDANGDGTASAQERQGWAGRTAAGLVRRLRLTTGGAPVELRLVRASMGFGDGQAGLPILRMTALFRGDLAGRTGSVEYRDRNYEGRIGWKEITAASRDGVALTGSTVPARSITRRLLAYPKDMLSSPLDVSGARFSFHPGPATQGLGQSSGRAGDTVTGAPVASGGGFARLITWRLTPLLLAVSLLLAFSFGALHALLPGHGKTITAAYLVGAEARARQAMFVGAAVALMHTVSVLVIGVVALVLVKDLATEQVYPWLGLLTGLVAAGLGGALFRMRLGARRRGEDVWAAGHSHSHSHPLEDEGPVRELVLAHVASGSEHAGPSWDSSPEGRGRASIDGWEAPWGHAHHGHDGEPTVSRPRLAALAVAGGLLPSPTALVVLTGALSYHRLGYGLGLIFAFSVGLAAALTGIGLAALRTRRLVAARLSGRLGGLLPLASAGVIGAVGVFFILRSALQLA